MCGPTSHTTSTHHINQLLWTKTLLVFQIGYQKNNCFIFQKKTQDEENSHHSDPWQRSKGLEGAHHPALPLNTQHDIWQAWWSVSSVLAEWLLLFLLQDPPLFNLCPMAMSHTGYRRFTYSDFFSTSHAFTIYLMYLTKNTSFALITPLLANKKTS